MFCNQTKATSLNLLQNQIFFLKIFFSQKVLNILVIIKLKDGVVYENYAEIFKSHLSSLESKEHTKTAVTNYDIKIISSDKLN